MTLAFHEASSMWTVKSTQVISFLLGFASFFALNGCENHLSAAPAGIYIDSTTDQFLAQAFDDTKACTELTAGRLEDVSIVLMPPVFPCVYYAGGCSGEFAEPNLIKIGNLNIVHHELVHYLLYLSTGNPDTNHKSPLFAKCS